MYVSSTNADSHPTVRRLFRLLLSDDATGVRGRIIAVYAMLAAANLGAWAWAFAAFRQYPLLLGTALLAYGLGLRHAVDADHIAAIDNVTRKLMQDGEIGRASCRERV